MAFKLVLLFLVLEKSTRISASRLTTTATRQLVADTEYYLKASRNLSQWRASLYDKTMANVRLPSEGHGRFALFEPFVHCPNEKSVERWGAAGDGGKWLCGVKSMPQGCVIFSLGSNNQYDFEEAMLANTVCTVHTFDCTCDGHSLGDRHFFHKICIGSAESAKAMPNFITYSEAVAQMAKGGVTLLKMDVEGSEYDVFAGWNEVNAKFLPRQVSFELHFAEHLNHRHGLELNTIHMALLFAEITNLGYGIVSKELNPECGFCSEFTLIQIEIPVLHDM